MSLDMILSLQITVMLSQLSSGQVLLSADDLFPGNKYDVQLSLDAAPQVMQDASYTINMFSKHGQPFTCIIPSDTTWKSGTSQSPAVNNSFIQQLLSGLEKSDCVQYRKGWWTYEYCYRNHVVQYHEQGKERLSEILLGRFDSETDWDVIPENLEKPFIHKQNYTDGSFCELTFRPRRVEVHIGCNEGREMNIVGVEELETCVYRMVVGSPQLCAHPSFVTDKAPTVESIFCHPVTGDSSNETVSMSRTTLSISPRVMSFTNIGQKIRQRTDRRHIRDLLRQFISTLISPIPPELQTGTKSAFEIYLKLVRSGRLSVINSSPYSHSVERSELVEWDRLLKKAIIKFFHSHLDKLALGPKDFQIGRAYVLRAVWSLLISLINTKINQLHTPGARPLRFHHTRLETLLHLFTSLCDELLRPTASTLSTNTQTDFIKIVRAFQVDSDGLDGDTAIVVRSRVYSDDESNSNAQFILDSNKVDPQWNYSPIELSNLRVTLKKFTVISHEFEEYALKSDSGDAELAKSIGKVLGDKKFKVLVLRQMHDQKSSSPISSKAQTDMMLSMLKNLLGQVDPDVSQGFEIYDTSDGNGKFSTFYIVSGQERAKEVKRMEKLEQAYNYHNKPTKSV